MTTRKVIEIDVQDSSFKKFAESFAKFSAAVKGVVGDMNDLDKAQRGAAKTGAKLTDDARKKRDAERREKKQDSRDEDDRQRRQKAEQKTKDVEEQKASIRRKKEIDFAVKGHKEIAKWTADVAWNTGKAALNIAKWATIGGLAGGFGLGGLASSASGARRQSQGLGIDSGELRAAGVNFGKYIDPEAMLGKIADAQSSYGQQFRFGQVGVDPTGKNPADLMSEMLPKLVERFRSVGGKQEGADAMGLTQFASMEELRRLNKLTTKELSDTIEAYREDREKLKVDDSVNRDWQSFMVSIQRAGQTIETSLVKHLGVLAPQLEKFAKSVAAGIDTFLSNPDLGKWIDTFAGAIGRAAKYLGSKEFATDVATFLHAIHSMAKWLGKWFGEDDPSAKGGAPIQNAIATAEYGDDNDELAKLLAQPQGTKTTGDPAVKNHNPGNLRVPGSATEFQKFSSDDDGIRAMASQLRLYEDRDKLDTIAKIVAKYAPSSENNTKAYIAAVSQRLYGTDPNAHLDLHNPTTMAALISAMTKQENAKSDFTVGGVKMVIENNTGGNANTTIAALGGG